MKKESSNWESKQFLKYELSQEDFNTKKKQNFTMERS